MHDDILHSLDRGLTQAAAGELEDLGSFADELDTEELERPYECPDCGAGHDGEPHPAGWLRDEGPPGPGEAEKILITPEEMDAARQAAIDEIADLLDARGNVVADSNE